MMPDLAPGSEVAIIGAGIVGACCAADLADAGYRVTLIDRAEPGTSGPSKANAGHIAGASILPLPSPGTFRNLPRLLLDPNSPLILRGRYFHRIVPWLWRFALACRKDPFLKGVSALAELNRILWPCTDDLYERAGISDSLTRTPALFLYESDRSYGSALGDWSLAREFGVETVAVPVERLSSLEPALKHRFAGAIRADSWGVVADPLGVVASVVAYALGKGASFAKATAVELSSSTEGVHITNDDGARIRADALVVAAGAWSKRLATQFGDAIPLDVERGYNITVADPKISIDHALVFADRGIVATALRTGLRIGGLDELGGHCLPANPKLFRRISRDAMALFPDLDTSDAVEWMGHRPSLPDSLPVIGRSGNSERVFYAFGHGHYGLTHAPATARIIADLVRGRPPAIDVTPFSAVRFAR